MNKIETIYRMIIDGINLNDDTLEQQGISKKEIEELVAKKVIRRMGNGTYQLNQVEELRKYGVKLKQNGQNEQAVRCFEICYKMCPKGRNICLQAMLCALDKTEKPDYKRAFEIYANLEKIQPEENQTKNNLYLYLLSVIAYPPENYRKKSSKIIPKTLIPDDENSEMLEIIKTIVRNKFPYACELIKAAIERQTDPTVLLELEMLGFLCDKASFINKMSKENILRLIKQGDYQKVKDTLETTKKKRKLNVQETNILVLVEVIIRMQTTAEIPEVTNKNPKNLWEAIHGYNFGLAETMNNVFKRENEKENSDDAISLLLNKIKGLINGIKGIEQELTNLSTPTIGSPTSTIESPTEQTDQPLSLIKSVLMEEIEGIAAAVLSSGAPVSKTIQTYGMTGTSALLVKLVIARRHFEVEEYDTGDKYLKEVENSNLKTPVVDEYLKEVKENRTNYAEERKTYARRLAQILRAQIQRRY